MTILYIYIVVLYWSYIDYRKYLKVNKTFFFIKLIIKHTGGVLNVLMFV